MKKVTLDIAKNIIGGTCSYSFDLQNDVCVQTISCAEVTKYGTATNVTKKDVASTYCGVEPQV
ncbi:hypothetical protein GWD52_15830 [Enterobacteriaceae bacterium 4M9]|nr:hypothetical protein [Enterobacteriaceae bacterium 4M9]